jgi:DNA-binding beta-propeller fold protein YncE
LVVDLPSSKQIVGAAPGNPQRVNSEPVSMAVSPDGRYVVMVNAGYGTFESKYEQSLAVMDTRTGVVTDFPDERTATAGKQTLYSGLAFSGDGRHLYASMASLTDPTGSEKGDVGNGVVVYGFDAGEITPERMIAIGLQKLAGTRRTKLIGGVDGAMGVPYPAAIAVIPGPPEDGNLEQLLVADNLSDDVLLIDATTGVLVKRFDLSESDAVPSTYPIAVAVERNRGGYPSRAFVALWNASEVVELDLKNGTLGRRLALLKPSDPVKPGTHPCALEISPDGKTLYVALANRDSVAAIDINKDAFELKGYFDTRLPGQSYFGAEPVALALSADGGRLYVANMGSDAVAVIDTRRLTAAAAKQGMVEPEGFIPTEWMPMSLAISKEQGTGNREKLYIATDKGRGTGPNDFAQRQVGGSASSP